MHVDARINASFLPAQLLEDIVVDKVGVTMCRRTRAGLGSCQDGGEEALMEVIMIRDSEVGL
jgi:hypothetical protein